MFTENAPFATTHSLRRDYAKNIIELALRNAPGLLTESEKQRITPPFSGGIRNWRWQPERAHEKYSEGNSPLGFDWENYTLGSLVPGRSTYDYKHPGFVETKEKILWRIYDLGYSLANFGEIDKRIASTQWRPQHSTNIIDRYGEKYAWIAFYELYGLLDDEGTLRKKEFWEASPHPAEADIDPSFPGRAHRMHILKHDILKVTQNDPKKWVQSGPDPNFASYLVPDVVDGQTENWFLLNATFLRRDDKLLRNGFAFIRAFYVASRDFVEFREFVRTQSPGKWWRNLQYPPRGFFAGEFPWRSDVPSSRTEAFKVQIGQHKIKNIPGPRITLVIDGKRFPQIPHKIPKWRYKPIHRTLDVEVPIQEIPFDLRSLISRPSEPVLSKEFCSSAGLWIELPSWDMFDSHGRRVSITSRMGKFSNSDAAIYVARGLVKKYLLAKDMKLVWVVWGERQMLTGGGEDAGYKQYTQAYWWDKERVKRL